MKKRKWGRGPQPENPPTHVEVVDHSSASSPVAVSASPIAKRMTADYADAVAEMIEPFAAKVISKPPLRYLEGRELRDALVEILILRALKHPVPEHLSINDRIHLCGPQVVRAIYRKMEADGNGFAGSDSDDVKRARLREYAERAIPLPD